MSADHPLTVSNAMSLEIKRRGITSTLCVYMKIILQIILKTSVPFFCLEKFASMTLSNIYLRHSKFKLTFPLQSA